MQNFQNIPETQTLSSSREMLLNNEKTIMSLHSGTVFPTSNIEVGMLCYRTDQGAIYQLTSVGPSVWKLLLRVGNKIPFQHDQTLTSDGNMNNYVTAGSYAIPKTGLSNHPFGTAITDDQIIVVYERDVSVFQMIVTTGGTSAGMWVRAGVGSTKVWTAWTKVWTQANDGATSGLDADLLDGQEGSFYAPVNDAILTGNARAPTKPKSENSTAIATTAHVKTVVADYLPLSGGVLSNHIEVPAGATGNQVPRASEVQASIANAYNAADAAIQNLETSVGNALSGKRVKSLIPSAPRDHDSGQHSMVIMEDNRICTAIASTNGNTGCGLFTQTKGPFDVVFSQSPSNREVKKVMTSMYGTYVLFQSGELYYAGINTTGQAGIGNTATVGIFTKCLLPEPITDFCCSSNRRMNGEHIVACTAANDLYGWGLNTSGQAGDNTLVNKTLPVKITSTPLPSPVKKIVVINSTSYVLCVDGTLYTFGYNQAGINQLIRPDVNGKIPVAVTGIGLVDDIEAYGGYDGTTNWVFRAYGLLKMKDGRLFGFGSNNYGQLGINNTTSGATPSEALCLTATGGTIEPLGPVTHFGAYSGGYYGNSFAVRQSDGRLYTCGYSTSDALLRATGNNLVFMPVTEYISEAGTTIVGEPWVGDIAKVVSVGNSTGWRHIAILTTSGNIYTAGYSRSYELGTGTAPGASPYTVTRFTRIPVPTLMEGEKVVDLGFYGFDWYFHMLALTNYGRLMSCGYNDTGHAAFGNLGADGPLPYLTMVNF